MINPLTQSLSIKIREEKLEDIAAVRHVNVAAFGREGEANLVDILRGVTSTCSLVAVKYGQIVGHIFFSPVTISGVCTNNLKELLVFGLAPVAVLPDYQRQGIGSLLIQYGLKACDRLGGSAVVVLGSPEYYQRFGFRPAREKGLGCEYPVPDEVFMALEIKRGALDGRVGTVKYRPEFNCLD